jgi:polysaccharide biosynthesis/export protein
MERSRCRWSGKYRPPGRTPLKLEQDIATKLKSYIAEPEVTVIVQQINSQKFNILGMVNKPGHT